jgi:hypothetical protein
VNGPSLQRTLVITHGRLADQAGDALLTLLQERHVPLAAVACLPTEENGEANLAAALRQISLVNLPATLNQQGWQLARPATVALYVVCDVAENTMAQAGRLLTIATTAAQLQLGAEMAPALFLLAAAPADPTITHCLTLAEAESSRWTQGIVAMGLVNEVGLSLTDESELVAAVAKALGALIATPLGEVAGRFVEQRQSELGVGSLHGLGIATWAWSPEAVRQALVDCWLNQVVAHWLQVDSTLAEAGAAAHQWLQEAHLGAAVLDEVALPDDQRRPASFHWQQWQSWPRPWAIRTLLAVMAGQEAAEELAGVERQAAMAQQLEAAVQGAMAKMAREAASQLDNNPTGGIGRTQAWLDGLTAELGYLADLFVNRQAARQNQTAEQAQEQARLHMEISRLLANWPQPGFASWWQALRGFWRWPWLAWRYHRLVALGQRLAIVLESQAALRRQADAAIALARAYTTLQQAARQESCQVDEIGRW